MYALKNAAAALGVSLSSKQEEHLSRFLDLLLLWNKKVNLTAVTDPDQAVEAHLLDSLAALPAVAGASAVLDLGAGGGLPSIPLAIVLPETRFTLVDTVRKKVGFLKAAIADLDLENARAIHARAEGAPEREGLPLCDRAICRAFLALEPWLELAPRYLLPGGRAVAMLSEAVPLPHPLPSGARLAAEHAYVLPRSGARRRIAVFDFPG